METILVYNLRTIFFPGIQFHKIIWSIMEHHLKQKKTMLPSLKCQIFCFRSKFVSFTQLCRQQIQFSKIRLCHFLVYGKMASYKELKFTEKILRKMRHGWTDRDKWADEQDWFYTTPFAKTEVWSFFLEFRE